MTSETIDLRTVAQRLDAIHDRLEKLGVQVRGLVTSQAVEAKEYIVRDEAIKRHLRTDLKVAVSIAYGFGWRTDLPTKSAPSGRRKSRPTRTQAP